MKRFLAITLVFIVLFAFSGCDKIEDAIENKADAMEETLEQKINDATNALLSPNVSGNFTPVDPSQLITPDQAQDIALEHAGVKPEDAVGVHTILQIDDGRQEYEVTFRVGHMEYEYEIDAANGTILSADMD